MVAAADVGEADRQHDDRDARYEDDAAHRRRAGLGLVPVRADLPDLLPRLDFPKPGHIEVPDKRRDDKGDDKGGDKSECSDHIPSVPAKQAATSSLSSIWFFTPLTS